MGDDDEERIRAWKRDHVRLVSSALIAARSSLFTRGVARRRQYLIEDRDAVQDRDDDGEARSSFNGDRVAMDSAADAAIEHQARVDRMELKYHQLLLQSMMAMQIIGDVSAHARTLEQELKESRMEIERQRHVIEQSRTECQSWAMRFDQRDSRLHENVQGWAPRGDSKPQRDRSCIDCRALKAQFVELGVAVSDAAHLERYNCELKQHEETRRELFDMQGRLSSLMESQQTDTITVSSFIIQLSRAQKVTKYFADLLVTQRRETVVLVAAIERRDRVIEKLVGTVSLLERDKASRVPTTASSYQSDVIASIVRHESRRRLTVWRTFCKDRELLRAELVDAMSRLDVEELPVRASCDCGIMIESLKGALVRVADEHVDAIRASDESIASLRASILANNQHQDDCLRMWKSKCAQIIATSGPIVELFREGQARHIHLLLELARRNELIGQLMAEVSTWQCSDAAHGTGILLERETSSRVYQDSFSYHSDVIASIVRRGSRRRLKMWRAICKDRERLRAELVDVISRRDVEGVPPKTLCECGIDFAPLKVALERLSNDHVDAIRALGESITSLRDGILTNKQHQDDCRSTWQSRCAQIIAATNGPFVEFVREANARLSRLLLELVRQDDQIGQLAVDIYSWQGRLSAHGLTSCDVSEATEDARRRWSGILTECYVNQSRLLTGGFTLTARYVALVEERDTLRGVVSEQECVIALLAADVQALRVSRIERDLPICATSIPPSPRRLHSPSRRLVQRALQLEHQIGRLECELQQWPSKYDNAVARFTTDVNVVPPDTGETLLRQRSITADYVEAAHTIVILPLRQQVDMLTIVGCHAHQLEQHIARLEHDLSRERIKYADFATVVNIDIPLLLAAQQNYAVNTGDDRRRAAIIAAYVDSVHTQVVFPLRQRVDDLVELQRRDEWCHDCVKTQVKLHLLQNCHEGMLAQFQRPVLGPDSPPPPNRPPLVITSPGVEDASDALRINLLHRRITEERGDHDRSRAEIRTLRDTLARAHVQLAAANGIRFQVARVCIWLCGSIAWQADMTSKLDEMSSRLSSVVITLGHFGLYHAQLLSNRAMLALKLNRTSTELDVVRQISQCLKEDLEERDATSEGARRTAEMALKLRIDNMNEIQGQVVELRQANIELAEAVDVGKRKMASLLLSRQSLIVKNQSLADECARLKENGLALKKEAGEVAAEIERLSADEERACHRFRSEIDSIEQQHQHEIHAMEQERTLLQMQLDQCLEEEGHMTLQRALQIERLETRNRKLQKELDARSVNQNESFASIRDQCRDVAQQVRILRRETQTTIMVNANEFDSLSRAISYRVAQRAVAVNATLSMQQEQLDVERRRFQSLLAMRKFIGSR